MVHDEQSTGIVLRLDGAQPAVIRSPEGLAPRAIEVVALRDVGTCLRCDPAQLCGRFIHGQGILVGPRRVGGGAREAGVLRRGAGRDDAKGKGVQDVGIGRRLAGGRDRVGRRTGKPLVEVESDRHVATRGNQRSGEALALVAAQQRSGQPDGVIAVDERAHLLLVPGPPRMRPRRARPVVGDHRRGPPFSPALGVPPSPGRDAADVGTLLERIVAGRGAEPVEERLPDACLLRCVEALAHQRDLQRVVRPDGNALPPVGIEQAVGVEVDESTDQSPECRIGSCLDLCADRAERRGKLVGSQREFRQDAEAAAAAALDGPEEVRIVAGVDGADGAVRGDDLGLQQRRGRHAEALGE